MHPRILRVLRRAVSVAPHTRFYIVGGGARVAAGVQPWTRDVDVFFAHPAPRWELARIARVVEEAGFEPAVNPLIDAVLGRSLADPCRLVYVPGRSLDRHLENVHFTVGAVAVDPVTVEVIDPFGGLRDYARRVLRAVGNPEELLARDPVAAAQAAYYIAVHGLEPDEELRRCLCRFARGGGLVLLARLRRRMEGRCSTHYFRWLRVLPALC